ncbi:hypothetical protein FOZ63_029877, partial [Perkinsus olseni]
DAGMHSSGTSFYRAHSTSSRSFATGGTMSSSVLTNPWARAEQKRCSPEQIDLIMRQFSTLRCILGSIGRRGGREGKQMRSEIEAIYDAMYEAVASMEFGFFERFSEKQVRDIVKVLQIRRMREGDVVCHKGEEGHEFYLIFRGAVDIYPEPKEPPVASFVAGDSFGELALIHDAPRAAAVVCQTDCTFGVLHRVPFIRATSPQKVLVESRIVDFLSSCSPFCCIHTRKLWKSIDTWSQKRSLPGRCIYRSRSPWMPIESQGTEEAYDADVDMASEFRWSEQSFEVGPGDAPVPFIRVTEPELTPLPFFVVMRGKEPVLIETPTNSPVVILVSLEMLDCSMLASLSVRVHGTIAIHGKLAATWKSDEGEGREGISFSSEDCVDSDAVGLGFVVRVFENIPLFELSQGMFYGQGEYLLGPQARQILSNVSLSNLAVEAVEDCQTLAMDRSHFDALCQYEAEFLESMRSVSQSLNALEKEHLLQIITLLDRADFDRKSSHYMLRIMNIVHGTPEFWASIPDFAQARTLPFNSEFADRFGLIVAQRSMKERNRVALSLKIADKVEHANDEMRGYVNSVGSMDVLELLQEDGELEADKKASEVAEAKPADAPKNVEEETKKRKRSRKRQRRGQLAGWPRRDWVVQTTGRRELSGGYSDGEIEVPVVLVCFCRRVRWSSASFATDSSALLVTEVAKRSGAELKENLQGRHLRRSIWRESEQLWQARSVFLNNLPVEATSEWIKTTVLAVLPEGSNEPAVIERVHIGRDKKYPTRCAGWANVTFTSETVARDAVGKLDYQMVDCEELLKAAEEKEQQNTAATMDSGGPVNKRCGGHGPKGIRVTRRCLYATSGLQQQQQLNSKEDHKASSKSTASQFRLPTDLVEQLRNLVREHSLSDSPAGRLADSYRRTFGHRVPVQEYGFKNFVAALSSIPGVSTWEEKPQQIWFSWDTEEDADDDLSPPPPAADGGGGGGGAFCYMPADPNLVSSLCAAAASVFAKVGFDSTGDSLPSEVSMSVHPLAGYLLRAIFIALSLAANAAMMSYYIEALQKRTALQATVMNFGGNFLFSSIFGVIFFGERMSLTWLLGATSILTGVVLVAAGGSSKRAAEKKKR